MSKPKRPPRLAERLLRIILQQEEQSEKLGDFEEGFKYEYQTKGTSKARWWYWSQVLKVIPLCLKNLFYWSLAMIKNYLKIALRHIKRHKAYSFLNITGLALGMACCILILFWVQDELATNTFHKKSDSLYLVRNIQHYGSETSREMGSVPAIGPALKAEYPEIINAARFSNGQGEFLFTSGSTKFKELVQKADPEIFQIFTFPLIKGRIEDLFSGPNVMVLSESLAKKYFGRENPLGKTITLNEEFDFQVVGVMKDIPHNSTIRFNTWVPLAFGNKLWRPDYTKTWYNLAFRTYVEVGPNFDLESFNKKIVNRIRESRPETNSEPFLYPFNKIYLQIWGRMGQIRTFTIIAFLILIIACINFMNLTTARSSQRSREVGLRKVVGAKRSQVTKQFFGESILFTFISLVTALILVRLLMPFFRTLTGKPLYFLSLINMEMISGIFAVTVLTGFIAGIYPAVFLSSFRPASVLKGKGISGKKGDLFRKILVVVQFSLSVMLIIGTLVIFNQVKYIKNKNLGFDKEHLLYIRVEGNLKNSYASMKNELLQDPGIKSIALTTHSPAGIYNNGQDWDWEGRDPNVNPLVTYFGVDPDFPETFQMEMVKGESFRKGTESSGPNVLINERFAEIIGLDNIIGARLSQDELTLQVMGVVKDFHFTPLNREIGPLLLYHNPQMRAYNYMFIRLNPGDIPGAIASIKEAAKKFNPGFPFEYRFLDQDYDLLYRSLEREMGIVQTFTFLAILISCLGLFGLASFTAEQRTKEIGIRKVLGASVSRIIFMLSKEYAKWVLIANIIAWPVAYFLMRSWLNEFPYRINLSWVLFFATALLSLLIAQITVTFQAFKAAHNDPAASLRYE
ncbi:MAG: ABC transporter permease [Candidatus Aminicenantes bacterium]